MSQLFDDLKMGLEQAIEYEKGLGSARVQTITIEPVKSYKSEQIKNIRRHTSMTQVFFANYMGVSPKTVESWERGTNRPTGSACRLLDILSSDKIRDMPFVKMG